MADVWTTYTCGIHAGEGLNSGQPCPVCSRPDPVAVERDRLRGALFQIAQGETPNGYVDEPTVLFAASVLREAPTEDGAPVSGVGYATDENGDVRLTAITDEMVERAMQVIAATFGACDNHTARAALVAALSHQPTPDEPGER